jgi:hypothetical protein
VRRGLVVLQVIRPKVAASSMLRVPIAQSVMVSDHATMDGWTQVPVTRSAMATGTRDRGMAPRPIPKVVLA